MTNFLPFILISVGVLFLIPFFVYPLLRQLLKKGNNSSPEESSEKWNDYGEDNPEEIILNPEDSDPFADAPRFVTGAEEESLPLEEEEHRKSFTPLRLW